MTLIEQLEELASLEAIAGDEWSREYAATLDQHCAVKSDVCWARFVVYRKVIRMIKENENEQYNS